jgi:hypothetical protein
VVRLRLSSQCLVFISGWYWQWSRGFFEFILFPFLIFIPPFFMNICHRPLWRAVDLSRQHIILYSVFKLGSTSVTCNLSEHTVGVRLGPLGTSAIVWPIEPSADDRWCWVVGGMRICKGNRSTRRKSTPAPLCPPHILHDLIWDRTLATEVKSRRLTAWDMAPPRQVSTSTNLQLLISNNR